MTEPEDEHAELEPPNRGSGTKRPPVTRLSRKVLLGLGVVATAGVAAALIFALAPHRSTTGSELYNTSNRTTPDGLANLPRDYAGLPRGRPQLGPPLPGDLGKPILNAGAPAPGMPAGTDPEQQRIAQEQEAARTSQLFATTNLQQALQAASGPAQGATATPPLRRPGRRRALGQCQLLGKAAPELTPQDHKLAFLNGTADQRTTSPDRSRRRRAHMCCRRAP